MAGEGSRASRALLACPLLFTTACVVIAGASDKTIDPCFDGCDDGGASSSGSTGFVPEPGEPSDPPPPGTSSGSNPTPPQNDGGPGTTTDGGKEDPCPCPQGTQRDGDVCRSTAQRATTSCKTPLLLPNCEVKLSLQLCDSDPSFPYDQGCGGTSRPSLFFRIGDSPTGAWKGEVKGPFSMAKTNEACTRAGEPCAADYASITINSTTNGTVWALSKRNGAGCDTVSIELEFLQKD